jgi:hypothetical protein
VPYRTIEVRTAPTVTLPMLSCATQTCYLLALLDPSRAMHRLPATIIHQLLLRNMEQVLNRFPVVAGHTWGRLSAAALPEPSSFGR